MHVGLCVDLDLDVCGTIGTGRRWTSGWWILYVLRYMRNSEVTDLDVKVDNQYLK